MQFHDPARQISFIQQALSQNRKPIGFFIGAGCPLSVRVEGQNNGVPTNEPLIPDVSGLTAIIKARMANDVTLTESWLRLTKIVKEDGHDDENVELLLSRIRQLHGVAGNGTVRELSAAELLALDEKICSVISGEVNRDLPTMDASAQEGRDAVRSPQAHPPARPPPTTRTMRRPRRVPPRRHRPEPQEACQAGVDDRSRIAPRGITRLRGRRQRQSPPPDRSPIEAARGKTTD
jgi:hypothetical protein